MVLSQPVRVSPLNCCCHPWHRGGLPCIGTSQSQLGGEGEAKVGLSAFDLPGTLLLWSTLSALCSQRTEPQHLLSPPQRRCEMPSSGNREAETQTGWLMLRSSSDLRKHGQPFWIRGLLIVTVQYMPQILKRYENVLQNIKVLLGFIAMNSVLYLNLLQNMLKPNLPDDVCAC